MVFESFHGTDPNIASKIITSGIDVSLGGGELGQGFYTCQYLHEAKAWAMQRFDKRKKNVLKFVHDDEIILQLTIKLFNYDVASLSRHRIKKQKQTRTYKFNVDMVWAPIVGSSRTTGDQYKWESKNSEILLNSNDTIKSII